MFRTHRNLILALVVLLIGLLSFGIYKQSLKVYRGVRNVQLPNEQSRQLSEFGIYNWITVPELARRYALSEVKIFELIGIVPEPVDYTLSLKELRAKYQKTPEEMRKALRSILDTSGSQAKPSGGKPTAEPPQSIQPPYSPPPNGDKHE